MRYKVFLFDQYRSTHKEEVSVMLGLTYMLNCSDAVIKDEGRCMF